MNNQTVTPSPAFAVGDRVRVTRATSVYSGFAGTVRRLGNGDGEFGVELDHISGSCVWYAPDQLEKVTPPAFAVGDRVRVAVKTTSYDGKIGTIKRIDGNVAVVNYAGEFGLSPSFFLSQLEKLPAETPQFAVGDRVRVLPSTSTPYAGSHGTIDSILSEPEGLLAYIRISPATRISVFTRNLEKVTEKPALAVGDTVRVIAQVHNFRGCTGTVKKALATADRLVEFDHAGSKTSVWFSTRELEFVSRPAEQRGPDAVQRLAGSAEMQSLKAQSERNAWIEAAHKVALSPVMLPDTPEQYVKREASARCALTDRAEKAEKKYALACEHLAILQKQYDELDAEKHDAAKLYARVSLLEKQRCAARDRADEAERELYNCRDVTATELTRLDKQVADRQRTINAVEDALKLCRAPLGDGPLPQRVAKLVELHGNQVDTINKQNAELQALKSTQSVAAEKPTPPRFFQHTAPDNFGAHSQWRVAEVAANGSVTMILSDGSRTLEPVNSFFGMADNYVKNGIWVEVFPRRFRFNSPGGFADVTTDYIECFPRNISFRVRKDGTRKDCGDSCLYPLSWCEEAVRRGHWVEVTS